MICSGALPPLEALVSSSTEWVKVKAPTNCVLHPASLLGADSAVNTNALFTVPPVSPCGGEFIWKFLWSTRPEQCKRRDHFLMHSYILSLYYPSGTVGRTRTRGHAGVHKKDRNLCGAGADRFVGCDKVNA